MKPKRLAILTAILIVGASPAWAATVVHTGPVQAEVEASPETGADTTLKTGDVASPTTEIQADDVASDNEVKPTTTLSAGDVASGNEVANGTQVNNTVGTGNVTTGNVASPSVNAPVTVTAPITGNRILTSEDDHSTYSNTETTNTNIDRSFNRDSIVDADIGIVSSAAGKASKREVLLIDLDQASRAKVKASEGKTLPYTGLDVGRLLALGLSLVAAGLGLDRIGARKAVAFA